MLEDSQNGGPAEKRSQGLGSHYEQKEKRIPSKKKKRAEPGGSRQDAWEKRPLWGGEKGKGIAKEAKLATICRNGSPRRKGKTMPRGENTGFWGKGPVGGGEKKGESVGFQGKVFLSQAETLQVWEEGTAQSKTGERSA